MRTCVNISVWYGFGMVLVRLQTKPNQTKSIPQKSTVFWYGFEAEPASNLNQKRTKNRTNNYVLYVPRYCLHRMPLRIAVCCRVILQYPQIH